MTENRKPSVPADNPEYFNLADWEGIVGDGSSQAETNQAILNNLGDLEPTNEVFESLVAIEKLSEKQNSTKTKKKKLGSSLKRLFSSSNRRSSGSGLENEYLPTPASPNDPSKMFGSLPNTPTKTPHNPFFRHSSESKTLKIPVNRTLSQPLSPITPEKCSSNPISRWYYNTDEIKTPSIVSKPVKTPVKSSKPPPAPTKSNTPRKTSVTSPLKSVVGRVRTRSSCSTGREGVPGMEAPPLPVLHSVCRGFVVKDMPRIVILYSGGCNISRQWRDYLAKVLEMRDIQQDTGKVYGQRVEEFSETGDRWCDEVVYHSKLVLVIISQKFTYWLDKTGIMLGKILHPSRVVGLMLGVYHEKNNTSHYLLSPALPQLEVGGYQGGRWGGV